MPSRSKASVAPALFGPLLARLRSTNAQLARQYPGESGARQPVHTVYGGAHLFKPSSAARLGVLALAALDEYAPDAPTLARVLDLPAEIAGTVRQRIVNKLQREPVEDFRIDFEDGYGIRPDAEEDGHAQSAASDVAAALNAGTLPPCMGIRIKPVSRELHARSLRTFELFVSTLVHATGRRLPQDFVVTIPKLMSVGQVDTVARACDVLERRLRLKSGSIRLELMIETPQAIVGVDGSSPLRAMVDAGNGRVRGAHFGAYDYTALCGITSSAQHMRHAACDFARHMMQVALAQSGVWLSDGATSTLPVPLHKGAADALTANQMRDNRAAVHRAWRLHYDDIRHSLESGFYQGWDLHPAQLPTRYAAVYAFFLTARPAATARLRNFIDQAARATLVGDAFDDAATGQGLLNFFLRALNSGALTSEEIGETGLTEDELQTRSFLGILKGRGR